MSSHTRCQQGDLAIITQDVPLCRANIGTLVRVLEPCYDFPKEYGFMWKIQPLSPHPTPVLLGVRGEDQEVVYDKGIRSHYDGWLMPVRPSNDNEEYTDLEAEQPTTRQGVTKLRGHSLIIDPNRWTQALALACDAHHGQMRKGTAVPYLSHVLAVSGLVLELGGDEDQALAGLLHDALEDGGPSFAQPIMQALGPRVLGLVQGCTDGLPDSTGAKEDWTTRKRRFLAQLNQAPQEVLLVSLADKLHNAQSIVNDLNTIGLKVFDRFNADRLQTCWYYGELAEIFTRLNIPGAGLLHRTVSCLTDRALETEPNDKDFNLGE